MSIQGNNTMFELKNFKPMKVVDVDISKPLPEISSLDENGQSFFQGALVFFRLHSFPIGLFPVDFIDGQISPPHLANQMWATFSEKINAHLQQDGLPVLDSLPVEGISSTETPKCLVERQEFIRDAPLVSIIVSTRERVQSLATALNSLLALEYPNFEIILVDNAPQTNETYEYFSFIQPVFLRNNINLRYVREDMPGLAVAHNRGLQLVRGSLVAFTDDDVIVDRYWLIELVRGFELAPNVGCVTGLVIPIELQTPAQVLFEEFGGFVKGFSHTIYALSDYRPADPLFPYTAGRFGTGANMAFRTDFLYREGGFDPALGIGTPSMGADDMGAFFQTVISGYQLVYAPSAIIFHRHRQSYESLKKQMLGYGTGLTAFIIKCMLDHPRLITDILSKIPTGVKYAFARTSPKNLHKSKSYPHELEMIERRGMLYGPIAYLRSRWRYRKFKKTHSQDGLNDDTSPLQHYIVTDWVKEKQGKKSTKEA